MTLSPVTVDETRQIDALLARQVAAWNAHDMAALVADMTPTVDWINVVGMHWQGRDVVEKAHAALHRLPMFANSRMVPGPVEMRRLSEDLILVVGHSRIEDTGPTPDGGVYPDAGAIQTLLLVATSDGWKIAHGHTTNKVAHAIAHDPAKRLASAAA